MNVRELIELLSKTNPDAIVKVWDDLKPNPEVQNILDCIDEVLILS